MNVLVYLIEGLIILLVIFSAYHSYFCWKTGVPTVSTSKKVRQRMVSFIPSAPCRIVELGSGWGGLAIEAALARPDCKVTGIEYSFVPYFVSRLRVLLNPALKNIEFKRGDFFSFSLKDVNAVLCYLLLPALKRLGPKLQAELPEGAVIVSNTYEIPDWTPEKTEETGAFFEKTIHVYKKHGAAA